MYIYLLKTDEGKKIIEYNKYEGITERCERPGGWGISRSISKNAKNCFFAYCDKFKNMHIVTVSKNQELLYLTYKNNRWHEYKIANIKEGIEIKKIMIGDTNICKNLFYSALYNGEYILVHCVLGNMAQPSTIDKMYDENFFVNRGRIIYTNKDFNVGFRSFSDGKPDNFIIIGNVLIYIALIYVFGIKKDTGAVLEILMLISVLDIFFPSLVLTKAYINVHAQNTPTCTNFIHIFTLLPVVTLLFNNTKTSATEIIIYITVIILQIILLLFNFYTYIFNSHIIP